MTTHDLTPSRCPACGTRLEAATGGAQGPKEGDYSVCSHCASILRFDARVIPRAVDVNAIESEYREEIAVVQAHFRTKPTRFRA